MADTAGMSPDFAAALDRLLAAAGGKIWIVSGFRDHEHQARLYNQKVSELRAAGVANPEQAARHTVAPPGHSNHERGLAADLGGDIALAHKLAPQFGLVFPMDWERWHVELVGTRDGASSQAYTTPPTGEAHPQQRPSTLEELLASASHGLGQLMTEDQSQLDQLLAGENPSSKTAQPAQAQAQPQGEGSAMSGDTASQFLAAIRQHESGGNYQAKNPHGSASGAYQFIDSTWNNFGGYAHAADAPNDVQDEKARQYLGGLQAATQDPRLWSVGWYGGGGMMQSVAAGHTSWDSEPNSGLSLRDYADWIVTHMGSSAGASGGRRI